MPFIDVKTTAQLTDSKKEIIKSELGKAVTILNKSETYLMVGIDDNYDLWFAGNKLDKGAYISVSLFGDAEKTAYELMTKVICDLMEREVNIEPSKVYITYHPVYDWGWNGSNF